MTQSLKRALILTFVILGGGVAGARAWPAHPAAPTPPAAPVAVPALAVEMDAPEPPDPPDPPEDSDGADVFVMSRGMTWLGVQIDDVSESKASDLKMKEAYGALVTGVDDTSPAGRAGMKENDVVITFQGQRVESAASLRRFVRETPAGRPVEIGVLRDGSPRTITVRLEEHRHHLSSLAPLDRIPGFNFKEFKIPGWRGAGPRLGISVNELNEQLAEYFGAKSGEGILVMEVMEGTPAEKAGLKAGDVILRVGGDRIESVGDIHEAIRDKAGKEIEVIVLRNHKEITLKTTLDADDEDQRSGLRSHLNEEIRQQIMQAQAEARRSVVESRRAQEEARVQQREAMRDAARTLRDAERYSVRGQSPVRIRTSVSGGLVEI